MKRATFFFRNGGIIITAISDEHTVANIGQRMCAGGFIGGKDNFWGKERETVINLGDVQAVVLEPMTVKT